jgi:hypothetical protein
VDQPAEGGHRYDTVIPEELCLRKGDTRRGLRPPEFRRLDDPERLQQRCHLIVELEVIDRLESDAGGVLHGADLGCVADFGLVVMVVQAGRASLVPPE